MAMVQLSGRTIGGPAKLIYCNFKHQFSGNIVLLHFNVDIG